MRWFSTRIRPAMFSPARILKPPRAANSKAAAKLRSHAGFTLTELLVSIAIMAISGAALAVSLNSSVRIYTQLTTMSEANVLAATLETAVTNELRFARDFVINADDGGLTWNSDRAGYSVRFVNTEDGYIMYSSVLSGGERVESDLIRRDSYTGTLTAGLSMSYNSGIVNVILTVSDNNDSNYIKREFPVRLLNPPE